MNALEMVASSCFPWLRFFTCDGVRKRSAVGAGFSVLAWTLGHDCRDSAGRSAGFRQACAPASREAYSPYQANQAYQVPGPGILASLALAAIHLFRLLVCQRTVCTTETTGRTSQPREKKKKKKKKAASR